MSSTCSCPVTTTYIHLEYDANGVEPAVHYSAHTGFFPQYAVVFPLWVTALLTLGVMALGMILADCLFAFIIKGHRNCI